MSSPPATSVGEPTVPRDLFETKYVPCQSVALAAKVVSAASEPLHEIVKSPFGVVVPIPTLPASKIAA